MRRNLIGQPLLWVTYHGDNAKVHTIEIDGDGGTGSNTGLITITLDTTAHAFDLGGGTYGTLGALVAGINAIDGLCAKSYGCLEYASYFDTLDITGDGFLDDLAASALPSGSTVEQVTIADHNVVVNGTDYAGGNSVIMPVSQTGNDITVALAVVLADAGTSAVTAELEYGFETSADKLTQADFVTGDSITVNATGTTSAEQVATFEVPNGCKWVRIASITNGNTEDATVTASLVA